VFQPVKVRSVKVNTLAVKFAVAELVWVSIDPVPPFAKNLTL
jgi:hypothetical protein